MCEHRFQCEHSLECEHNFECDQCVQTSYKKSELNPTDAVSSSSIISMFSVNASLTMNTTLNTINVFCSRCIIKKFSANTALKMNIALNRANVLNTSRTFSTLGPINTLGATPSITSLNHPTMKILSIHAIHSTHEYRTVIHCLNQRYI